MPTGLIIVETEHIQAWIAEGKAAALAVSVSETLSAHLDSLPWNTVGMRLDWDRIGGEAISFAGLSDDATAARLASTALGRGPGVVFLFGAGQPALICPTAFALRNIDAAFWQAPGPRYLFSASGDAGDPLIDMTAVAEYDGADRIMVATGSCAPTLG